MRIDVEKLISDEDKAHSLIVNKIIQEEIQAKGHMPFSRFMELALYAPGQGYYTGGAQKFGSAGDFTTAPEISPMFSWCIARQCQQVMMQLDNASILEFGAGSGVMALEIMRELRRLKCLPEHYYILELSAELQQRQKILFEKEEPELLSHIKWLSELPQESFNGVILANEVLDAMPVHKFRIGSEVEEFKVGCDGEETFEWKVDKQSTPQLQNAVDGLDCQFEEGYESELNLLLPSWMAALAKILNEGLVLLIDYGFPRHEYYHPDRSTGTIMCHLKHHAHTDPLLYPGVQDITAHVDFTAVAESADQSGFEISGYTQQAYFLMNCGLAEMLPSPDDIEVYYGATQQVKTLTLPSEMGELFKVMALTKGFDEVLLGFVAMDQLNKL